MNEGEDSRPTYPKNAYYYPVVISGGDWGGIWLPFAAGWWPVNVCFKKL